MKELLEKINNGLVLSIDDIIVLADYYVDELGIRPFFKGIKIDSNNYRLGCYNRTTHEIILNDKSVIEEAYRVYDIIFNKKAIDEKYYAYYLNFFYLHTIFHELRHVFQTARYETMPVNDNSLFSYLYELCVKLRYDDPKLYQINHNLFPMEIDANNNGYLQAYNFMLNTNIREQESILMHVQYYYILIHYYQKMSDNRIITPIDQLAIQNRIVDINHINEILTQEPLSVIDKMNLGVTVTPLEYTSIVMEKEKCYAKFKNNKF